MRFYNIVLEGPDCSGKSTLFRYIHNKTNFKYNIIDRSFLSRYVYSKFYKRHDASFWYEKMHEEIKSLNTLIVILCPSEDVLLERLKSRGDEYQDENSLIEVKRIFEEVGRYYLSHLPNVLFIESLDAEENYKKVIDRLRDLNTCKGSDLVKNLVINSFKNEVVDVSLTENINIDTLDFNVLNFPQEKEYYENIISKMIIKIQKELMGLNEYRVPQKIDSRRFIYTDDSCISMIHALFRDQKLNVVANLRSSNMTKTFWADYEFLKILTYYIAKEMNVNDHILQLTINIRSAHLVP